MGSATYGEGKIPLWLDCDPGHDDAFAILFAAHHPSLHLLGISTVYGNASLNRTTTNCLRVLEAIGRPEVPVYPGASKPYCRVARHAPDIHGRSSESGLDGTDLLPMPSRHPLTTCNPIIEMRDALISCPPHTAWLVATGSLTNVALLFAVFPEVAGHIKGLSIMGGAIGNNFTSVPLGPSFKNAAGEIQPRIGNHTPYAEFNIWCDPESAESIFTNPVLKLKTVLIPLDVTHQAFAAKEIRDLLLYGSGRQHSEPTMLRQMFHDLLMFFAKTYSDVFGLTEGPPLHDPLAVAILLADHVRENTKIDFDDRGGERWEVIVKLSGDEVGRTLVVAAREGVLIPRTLDTKKFWTVLNECLEKADVLRSQK